MSKRKGGRIHSERKIKYDRMKTANYKPNLLTTTELFRPNQATVLCKQKLVNFHSGRLDRELQTGVIPYLCIPMSGDFLRLHG